MKKKKDSLVGQIVISAIMLILFGISMGRLQYRYEWEDRWRRNGFLQGWAIGAQHVLIETEKSQNFLIKKYKMKLKLFPIETPIPTPDYLKPGDTPE
jgi:hypothetical protein